MKKVNEKTWVKTWSCGAGIGLPLLVLVIGLYWLAKELGYFQTTISIWPIIFIVFGIYWIIKAIVARHYCQ
jgi:hypothetical protein